MHIVTHYQPTGTEHLKPSDTNFGLPVASEYEVLKVLWKDVVSGKAALG